MTYGRHRGMVGQYLYGKRYYLRRNKAMTLTHSFVDVAFKVRIFGIRHPELADYVGLVQVEIDNIDNS